MNKHAFIFGLGAVLAASPALAQNEAVAAGPPQSVEATVYDGDWLSLGLGVGYGPSYDGSDDYTVFPFPLVQGSLAGVAIVPRPAGVALDFIPNPNSGIGLDAGIAARVRTSRVNDIKDPVVESLGELDYAAEVGPTVGFRIPRLLNDYDSLSASVDVLWDVAGAHDGMVVSPLVTYFTPLSRGIAAALSVSAEHGDDDFMDYYYSVGGAQSLASGLPSFQAESGWNKVGGNLLVGVDLDGDLANGGLSLVFIGGYSRMLEDAGRSPFTSIRGDADQWLAAAGFGYTF